MPSASVEMPSLALTQLASVIKERFGDAVSVETVYLNLDFAHYVGGHQCYKEHFVDASYMTGVGDWFFRQSAFPESTDNSGAYFDRFYFTENAETHFVQKLLIEKREGLNEFLDSLIEKYDLASADIVGFTTLFSQVVASCAMAKRLKTHRPNIVTCMGGAACEGQAGRTFSSQIETIDYVFSGPSLISFPTFVEYLMSDRQSDCHRINGIFPASSITDGNDPPLTGDELDINTHVELDYTSFLDAFDRAFPDRDVNPVLLFQTSRGCYWAEKSVCTFCGLNGAQRHYHQMTPDRALRQITSLYRWVPRCSSFIAVDTAMPRDYVSTVFPFLNAPDKMKMMYEVRADMSRDELTTMCSNGVRALQPGIEALSTATLKLMRKGTSAFTNILFLKACSDLPLSLDWNLLIYSPGEEESTYECYQRTLPLLTHLAPPTGVYPIMFVRHSRYTESPDAYGLDLYPQDFYGLTYPFNDATIRAISNHFVDRNSNVPIMDQWLEKLNKVVHDWRIRWQGRDSKPQARLCFIEDEGSYCVYDSRSGTEIEHPVSETARRILKELEKPTRPQELAQALCRIPDETIKQEMNLLIAQGLLFEENGRYLSLVTP